MPTFSTALGKNLLVKAQFEGETGLICGELRPRATGVLAKYVVVSAQHDQSGAGGSTLECPVRYVATNIPVMIPLLQGHQW